MPNTFRHGAARFAILVAAIAATPAAMAMTAHSEQALDSLDQAMRLRQHYIDARQHTIDSLTALRNGGDLSPDLLLKIADRYTSFNNDSALVTLRHGIESTMGTQQQRFRWRYASLLPLSGFFDEAQTEYGIIDADSVPADMLAEYYEAGRQMHSYIASFFRDYPEVYNVHRRREIALQEKLIELLPDNSPAYKYYLGEYHLSTGHRQMAKVLLEDMLAEVPPGSNLRARAAHHLATIARADGDINSYIYYLALSARSDIESATREVTSLQDLGAAIYDTGEVSRAYSYLSTALATAVECGAPLRMVESSRSLPIIERSHNEHIMQWRRMMVWVTVLMGLLVVGLIAMMLVLRHEIHKMRVLQNHLRAANTTKEVYISQFLQLCSIYMDKLNSFCKIATRKLAAGQSDELYRMTKSGKFVEEQSREFYEVFDNAFLHIYPDFPERVNALLQPDKQIVLNEGEQLNTDLRILAFMRLGIDDSARIAQILNYSLNTIYNYRNRLKARAINRDTFEHDIMLIDSVE